MMMPGRPPPFVFSIETHEGRPRGQIHFSHPDWVRVDRIYNNGCPSIEWTVSRAGVCHDDCEVSRPDLLEQIPGCSATRYRERIISDPLDVHYRGPKNELRIEDTYVFEMDQDYGLRHNSAPSCRYTLPPYTPISPSMIMRDWYTQGYGDPDWNWRPSTCLASFQPGSEFGRLAADAMVVTALTTEELRARIDGLRHSFGLSSFVWTDPAIRPLVTVVKAVHVTELRTALNETYEVAGRQLPTYTDSVVIAGVTPIRAVHVIELRAAIRALEQR